MTAHTKNRRGFWLNFFRGDGGDKALSGPASRFLLSELTRFVGEGWEQEDDITLVTLERRSEEQ